MWTSLLSQDCGRGFKEREMLPDNQYQANQESQPLAKTDIWRLNHAGLYARRPAVSIPLMSAHKRDRLNWSLKHQHWSVGEGVMVWAGIMMEGRTDLHFFDTVSVTAQRYRDEVLKPYVRLFRGAVGPDFIFINDNAPCHRAVLIDDFLETENIQHMLWPANSPDLNTIKDVWNMLGRQIAALFTPTNLHYRTEESSPRSLEPFEPITHSSSHSKYGKSLYSVPGCQK
ncbi:transposable element Tcb2 transposase [Trichonephila clavipes]|nr:transposable element Tcb2 transposase [Trichonephila clavipes]